MNNHTASLEITVNVHESVLWRYLCFWTSNWNRVIKYDLYVNFPRILAHKVQICAKFCCKNVNDVCPVFWILHHYTEGGRFFVDTQYTPIEIRVVPMLPLAQSICVYRPQDMSEHVPGRSPSKLTLRMGNLDPHLIHGSLGPPETTYQTTFIEQFGHFCRAHDRHSPINRQKNHATIRA